MESLTSMGSTNVQCNPGDGELTELPELAVGDEQSAKSSQALQSLLAMLLGGLLVDGGAGNVDGLGVPLLGLPDEVLEQVALVLGQKQVLGLLDNVASVGNECLALGRKLLGGVVESGGGEEAVQGDIDLVVLVEWSVSR